MPIAKKKTAPKKKALRTVSKKKTSVTKVKKALRPPKKVLKKRKEYLAAIGRRKQSIARVRLYLGGDQGLVINGKTVQQFFSQPALQRIVSEAILLTNAASIGGFTIKVAGGGVRGQAESIRLGISRVLVKHDESLKHILRSHKLLTVDARVKERKKYGLKKARRAPQWQKR